MPLYYFTDNLQLRNFTAQLKPMLGVLYFRVESLPNTTNTTLLAKVLTKHQLSLLKDTFRTNFTCPWSLLNILYMIFLCPDLLFIILSSPFVVIRRNNRSVSLVKLRLRQDNKYWFYSKEDTSSSKIFSNPASQLLSAKEEESRQAMFCAV